MTTHFLDKSNSCNLKRGGRRKFIARLTPKFFICLKFKTVTAPHNIVFYALLSLLLLSVQNTWHAYLEPGMFPVKSENMAASKHPQLLH